MNAKQATPRQQVRAGDLRRLLDELTSETVSVDIVAPDGTIDRGVVVSARVLVVGDLYPTNTLLLQVASDSAVHQLGLLGP